MMTLAQAWEPVFSTVTPINTDLARSVASRFSSDFSMNDYSGPPSSIDIHRFLRHVRHTAPGVDGIPYCAWLRAGPRAWALLHQVGAWMSSGLHLPLGFNDTLAIFIPKGSEEDDDRAIVREPMSIRPIGLKNSDVKIISGSVHSSIKHAVAEKASHLQN